VDPKQRGFASRNAKTFFVLCALKLAAIRWIWGYRRSWPEIDKLRTGVAGTGFSQHLYGLSVQSTVE
jgi:hypothetical protein